MNLEQDYCDDYVAQRPESYDREVPVGNILLKDEKSVHEAASGSFAGLVDALQISSNTNQERLVECKTSPTFRGVGQLLLYIHLRQRDRELVRDAPVSQTDHDTIQNPNIEEIEPVLAVGEIKPSDTPLLSAYANLGVTIEHRTDGVWREVDRNVVSATAGETTPELRNWLAAQSRDSLDSAAEDTVWEDCASMFSSGEVFREIPIGTHLYPNHDAAHRADIVVYLKGYWFVVEIKDSTSKGARTDFQQAVGQATSYANLFTREWDLPPERVAPVVVQQPLAVVGGVYRDNRYGEDYHAMRDAALADTKQPLILGPAQAFC
jgi:hypothetical protein